MSARNSASMPDPPVKIYPSFARADIEDGEWAYLKSDMGRIKCSRAGYNKTALSGDHNLLDSAELMTNMLPTCAQDFMRRLRC